MKKTITIFCFSIIFILISLVFQIEVKAALCGSRPNGCVVGCECYRHEGTIFPGWGSDPSADPNTINNCVNRTLHTNYGVQNVGSFGGNPATAVTASYGPRFYFCAQNHNITTTAAGEVIIYARTVNFQVKGPGGVGLYQRTSPVETVGYTTGINVLDNQQITVNTGEYSWDDAIGWKANNGNITTEINNFFTNARANAAANGYVIISEQTWADAWAASVYDGYDFNDMAIMVAIKPPANPPTCAENQVQIAVSALDEPTGTFYLSEGIRFSVTQGLNPTLYTNPSNNFNPAIGLTVRPGFGISCTPSQNNPKECTISNKVNTGTTTVTWTHSWQNCRNGLCVNCSTPLTFSILPYPGTMSTNGGDFYARNNINEIRLDRYNNLSLAKYTISSFQDKSSLIPNGSRAPLFNKVLSLKEQMLFQYNDTTYSGNIYDGLVDKIRENTDLYNNRQDYSSTTIDQTAFNGFQTGSKKLVDVTGSLTISDAAGITCKSKTIFLISGNLTINSNFSIQDDNACLFIVRGLTTFGVNVTNVRAFILTQGFTTTSSINGFTLTGGLTTTTSVFNRNINRNVVASGSINKNAASELINYEGARYYRHFKDYLNSPLSTSITEL